MYEFVRSPVLSGVRKFAKSELELCHVCMSVRPAARNNLALNERIFMKFCLCIFRKHAEKPKVSLKSEKNKGYIT
jgi:hypothetical protein